MAKIKEVKDDSFSSFESSMEKLKVCVARLRDHQLTLSEAMAAYREGVDLSKSCQKQLQEAEQIVRVIEGEAGSLREVGLDESFIARGHKESVVALEEEKD